MKAHSTCSFCLNSSLEEGCVVVDKLERIIGARSQALDLVERLRGVHLLCRLPFIAICRSTTRNLSFSFLVQDCVATPTR